MDVLELRLRRYEVEDPENVRLEPPSADELPANGLRILAAKQLAPDELDQLVLVFGAYLLRSIHRRPLFPVQARRKAGRELGLRRLERRHRRRAVQRSGQGR